MLRALFIDAGHGLGPTGGIDNGASGNGTTERAEVVQMAQELIARIQKDPAFIGVRVVQIGVESRMMLKDKIKEVNDECRINGWSPSDTILISLHLNATSLPSARGLEAWFSKQKPAAHGLARTLLEELTTVTGLPLRPTTVLTSDQNRLGRLGILDDTVPTACLVECGFVTNEFDAKILKDAELDDRFADGLHRGLRRYLSLSPSPANAEKPTTFSDVPSIAWYASDVDTCLKAGLFKMPSDGKFHPDRPITRAELAAVMTRMLKKM